MQISRINLNLDCPRVEGIGHPHYLALLTSKMVPRCGSKLYQLRGNLEQDKHYTDEMWWEKLIPLQWDLVYAMFILRVCHDCHIKYFQNIWQFLYFPAILLNSM